MYYVKHATLAPEQLHGQTMIQKQPASAGARIIGRLFVSNKNRDGSFTLRFRSHADTSAADLTPGLAKSDPDSESEELASQDGRVLLQSEVNRIRANSNGERQLTGCAFTLEPVDSKFRPPPVPRPPGGPGRGRRFHGRS